MRKTITESQLRQIVKESVKKVLKEGIWNAIEADDYMTYDAFVNFIKNYYAPQDDNLAYRIEDDVNKWMVSMFSELDKTYR